ncbi:hypothetical protein [Pseudonocardia spinosispora]|uniref:hypothetical protein n=1 Tax=Pseudonocardia spinosispora TaxID=103441 RepID=UPI000421AA68|nr:hypothetical protein [Pseudonocardia spinosispora]
MLSLVYIPGAPIVVELGGAVDDSTSAVRRSRLKTQRPTRRHWAERELTPEGLPISS